MSTWKMAIRTERESGNEYIAGEPVLGNTILNLMANKQVTCERRFFFIQHVYGSLWR